MNVDGFIDNKKTFELINRNISLILFLLWIGFIVRIHWIDYLYKFTREKTFLLVFFKTDPNIFIIFRQNCNNFFRLNKTFACSKLNFLGLFKKAESSLFWLPVCVAFYAFFLNNFLSYDAASLTEFLNESNRSSNFLSESFALIFTAFLKN